MKYSITALSLLLTSNLVFAIENAQIDLTSDDKYAIKTLTNAKDDTDDVQTLYKDLDQDGVADRQDHCLNTEYGFPVDAIGCELDKDGDGVFDRVDQCPYTPKGMSVNFLGCEPDKDKDLVLDSKDQCPNTPLGTKVDAVGCKLENDNDNDGVLNSVDLCPETPLGTEVNKVGCKPESFIIANIVFNTGSYAIRADVKPILDNAAAKLHGLEKDKIILITGHTDSVGTEYRNRKLSWNRAQSTKEYFMSNFNYDDAQIFVLGKGELKPIETNKTAAGRFKNRRITFSVITKEELPETAAQNIPEDMKGYQRFGYKNAK